MTLLKGNISNTCRKMTLLGAHMLKTRRKITLLGANMLKTHHKIALMGANMSNMRIVSVFLFKTVSIFNRKHVVQLYFGSEYVKNTS